jgi:perosamine synthetase
VIRVTDVRLPRESIFLANYVMSTGKLAQGWYVDKLESLAAIHCGTTHAVAVSSGTAALSMALMAVGATEKRVAIPAMTFAGTANAVIAAGGEPVVVDVGEDRFINPDLIPADVDFVMPVHLYGARMDVHRLVHPVVEDAAQAIGHTIGYGGISLYGSKTVGCGEGGLLVTSDDEIADWARVFRNQGMRSKYQHVMPGLNYRITDLQAAVALGVLATLPEIIAQRSANADRLWSLLHDLPVTLPNPFGHVWHQFVVEVDNRDAVAAYMAERGVETGVHYPVSLSQIEWLEADPAPVAERMAARVLSLPVHEHLTEAEVETVASVFREAVLACVSV